MDFTYHQIPAQQLSVKFQLEIFPVVGRSKINLIAKIKLNLRATNHSLCPTDRYFTRKYTKLMYC